MIADWKAELGRKDEGLQHHAYLLVGHAPQIVKDLGQHLSEEHGIETSGNPDFWHGEYDSFGIAEARSLKSLHVLRPVRGDKRIFVIETRSFTLEAQNALLKMFEEPVPGSHFFIIMSAAETLLPTLRSRLARINWEEGENTEKPEIAPLEFLAASVSTRLAMVQPIIDEKDVARAIDFIENITDTLHKNGIHDKLRGELLTDMMRQRQFLQSRGASVKMILEHVALTVPHA